jgi:hypothetical protein
MKLRAVNAADLRKRAEMVKISEGDEDLAVLIPWPLYVEMAKLIEAMKRTVL